MDDGDAGEKAFTPGLHSVAIKRSVVLEKIIVPISIGKHRQTEYDREPEVPSIDITKK